MDVILSLSSFTFLSNQIKCLIRCEHLLSSSLVRREDDDNRIAPTNATEIDVFRSFRSSQEQKPLQRIDDSSDGLSRSTHTDG